MHVHYAGKSVKSLLSTYSHFLSINVYYIDLHLIFCLFVVVIIYSPKLYIYTPHTHIRKQKNDWHQARAEATMHRGEAASKLEMAKKTTSTTGIQSSVADCELSFRAMEAHGDVLRFDVSCGFDISQFDILYPEEMSAYQRWKNMHDAYSEKSVDILPKSMNEEDDDTDKLGVETTATAAAAAPVLLETIHSGRVIERLSNFDARTDDMRSDDYLKFADIRRGSFLPRSGGGTTKGMMIADVERKRGRPSTKNRTTWTNLNPSSIVFLHWIGFDPTSALSPPNEETTQALGYLAYDFFGRIVEKVCEIFFVDQHCFFDLLLPNY